MNAKPYLFLTVLSALGTAVAWAADKAPKNAGSSATPCMDVLHLFTAADVPAFAPSEIAVPERGANGITRSGLPGKGLAQHPMLYVGENCNKMFLVKDGKVIWTYSTGPRPEFDDVWMLSNGNILFSRMEYVAVITPDKKVVWRYDCHIIQRRQSHRNPCLPAHWLGQSHVRGKWPAAQAEGHQHQDRRRGG